MIKLNLGCGNKVKEGYVNIDSYWHDNINIMANLENYPWHYEDNSVDEIYASHIIEHFQDEKKFLTECMRILKYNGTLHIIAPHSSSPSNIGCMGHYRTYSYNYFKNLLSTPSYIYTTIKFKTIYQKVNWWYEKTGCNVPLWMRPFLYVNNKVISYFINLAPEVFENLWWAYVGGAKEVEWTGVKR